VTCIPCVALPLVGRMELVFEEVLGQKDDVRGAFGQTAHEVGIPLGTKGKVDADPEALGSEAALEVATDAVQHLKLEGRFVDVVLANEGSHLLNDGFVVGGYTAENALASRWIGEGDYALHELDIVGVDVRLRGKGDCGAFFVGSLAEADADVFVEETLGVGFGAEEIGLEDGAYGSRELYGEALGHGDGGFGIGRAFHVDADEGLDVGGVLDHLAYDAFGEGGIEVHANLGELDADVGVEAAGVDGVEKLVIDISRFPAFSFGSDGFAEGVEGDSDAFFVDSLAGGERLFYGHAGYEAPGHLFSHRGAL
jgi:hypothetical protein